MAIAQVARTRPGGVIGQTPPSPWTGSMSTARCGARRPPQRLVIVARHVPEAGGNRREGVALGGRPAGGQRRERAPVERALETHDLVLRLAAADAASPPRELDRGLDRLGARVAEEDAPDHDPRARGAARRARRRARCSRGWRHARGGRLLGERLRPEPDARDRASTRRGRRPGRGTRSPARPRPCSRPRGRARAGARDTSAAAPPRLDRAALTAHQRPAATDPDTRDAADSAAAHASSFGSMPPFALAGGAMRRRWGSACRSRRARPARR